MKRLAILLSFVATPLFAEDVQLLMADQDGCYWCERWTEELGEIYPKTAEGRAAPLLRQDIDDPLPEGMALAKRMHFTPTFVLFVDGVENGRIEGYPGEDFFWGLLGMMLKEAQIPVESGS